MERTQERSTAKEAGVMRMMSQDRRRREGNREQGVMTMVKDQRDQRKREGKIRERENVR